ncbi:hypothetical protein M8J77_014319 [Diaphorina citri]|nr:hypothetical protein M8J77_014319 [Diaphorina citri]
MERRKKKKNKEEEEEKKKKNLNKKEGGKIRVKFELEDQLVRVLEKNSELTLQNSDLQKQVHQLQYVTHPSTAGSASGQCSSQGHHQGASINGVGASAGGKQDSLDEILKVSRVGGLEVLHSPLWAADLIVGITGIEYNLFILPE